MAQSPPTPGGFDRPLLRMIGVILLGGIMGILDSTMVTVAAGELAGEFGASLSTIGWVSAAYLLALTATIPATSWAVGRYGGRRLWLAGLAVFLAGSLASALAWDAGSLIAFRVLQGIGTGIIDPLVLILLARAAGPDRAGRVMGLMGMVLSLGPVLGPVLGGLLLSGPGWRWMFLINLPIGALAFLLARRTLPADRPGPGSVAVRLDVLGLALLGPGFAVAVLALSQTAERGEVATWPVLVPLAAGVLLLAGYAVHALRARRTPPLIDLRLFTSGGFTASVTSSALCGLVTYGAIFALPLYYQLSHGRDAAVAGLLIAPLGLGSALVMPVAGRLSDRFGTRVPVRLGGAVALFAALALTRVGADTAAVWSGLWALVLGLGMGVVGAPVIGSVYRTLPAAKVPEGSSVLYMLNQLGATLGIAAVAVVMQLAGDAVAGFHGAVGVLTAAIAGVLALSGLLPGRTGAVADTDSTTTTTTTKEMAR